MSAELDRSHHAAQANESSLGLGNDDAKLVRLYPSHQHESYLDEPLKFRRVWEQFRDYCQQDILFALKDATLSDVLKTIPIGVETKERISAELNLYKREGLLSIELFKLIALNDKDELKPVQARV